MEWHYSKNGQQHGPVSEADLITMVQNGSVAPTDLAWNKGMDGWKQVSEIAALNAQAASSAPSMAPPPTQAAPSQAPKRLSQEQKAQIHELKKQMKKEYERFVKNSQNYAYGEYLKNNLKHDSLGWLRTLLLGKWKAEVTLYSNKNSSPKEFYYDGVSIKGDGIKSPRVYIKFPYRNYDPLGCFTKWSKRIEAEHEGAFESFAQTKKVGKYDPELPDLDEFMEWRWRDLDEKGELEEGLIETMKLCD